MPIGPLVLPLLAIGLNTGWTQDPSCPSQANPEVETGWIAYRIGEFDSARVFFENSRAICRDHQGARIGLGYATMQLGDLTRARNLFLDALSVEPRNIDALLGSALVAWRSDSVSQASSIFQRVLELEPSNPTAREFLGRTGRILGTPPSRPTYQRPDTTVYYSRTHNTHFDIRRGGDWEPFYVKGVNLGTALPGKFATEFPDSITYATWIEQIGAMGANVIRVYTVHPPRFYQALWEYNTTRTNPLWLVHGAWATVPPGDNYNDAAWQQEFYDEMHDVVDVIHGRADLPPKADEGFRHYTTDISRWVVAIVFGREWESLTVANFHRQNPGRTSWSGTFVGIEEGNALEVWMTQATEEMISYEMETYNTQRPVAFTNWPTLDPLTHRSETNNAEEVAILMSLGVAEDLDPAAADEDAEQLDASRMVSYPEYPVGHFASYHAYPYYPDFMVLNTVDSATHSPNPPSNYDDYLNRLKRHHGGIPILIAEYGVPSSLGIARLQPQGWHHGGHNEQQHASINARLTRDIATSGMAGGIYFSWIDEWFKRSWVVASMTLPEYRTPLWLNRLDPEQHYGVLAMEPLPRLSGQTLEERLQSWQQITPLYNTDAATLRLSPDEAYLWLLIERKASQAPDDIFVGFDMLDSAAGDRRWPGAMGPRTPVGLEFVVKISGGRVEIVADSGANPWEIVPIRGHLPELPTSSELEHLDDLPAGTFSGRWARSANVPFLTSPNEDGVYTPLNVVIRRHRISRDTTEYPAVGYTRGVLPRGAAPDGLWESLETDRPIEIRIPWMLLNITDPSSRQVLSGADRELGPYHSVPVANIRVVAAIRSGARWETLPSANEKVAAFTWDRWERPRWRARPKPLYQAMQNVFRALMTHPLGSGH